MKQSYKKRYFTQILSLSTACLLSVLAQQSISANALDTPESSTAKNNVAALQKETPTLIEEKNAPVLEEVNPTTSDLSENSITKEKTEAHQEHPVDTTSDLSLETNKKEEKTIQLAENTIYLSEEGQIDEVIKKEETPIGPLTWTLDNKPIEEWKTWNLQTGDFSDKEFIAITQEEKGNELHVSIKTNALFGNDLSLRTPSNIRRTYRSYMGEHQLIGRSANQQFVLYKTLHFRPYESFQTHEEMLEEIEATQKNAASDRLVKIETIGTSAQQRPIKLGIISKNQESIDQYLHHTNPLALSKPNELLTLLEKGQLDYKLPILINNTHADEQPGIDIIRELFKQFATKDQLHYKTTDAAGNEQEVSMSIQQLLERFILLFDFTENPDGDVLNTRALANGLDPNRDTSYQANPETRAVAQLINKWNPIAVYDIHGFVKSFLIEPATPPHDPNFEYDLLSNLMLENAQSMGRAGIANSSYERFIIPKIDWGDGWDDSFSGYTAVYAMYHGIMGHTIEIPEGNQESYKAGFYAVLGGLDFLRQHPDRLMNIRLQFYLRGIHKIEDPKAEQELVGPNGEVIGRIKKGQEKFFPDYYVIPMGLDKNQDSQEAFNMIDYFKRNGVVVKELTKDTAGFKKGDLVIDMAQAKRGYANHILYKGSDESRWGAMYAELVVNFPDMKGFKTYPVFKEGLFDGRLGNITKEQASRTQDIDQKAPYYIIANTSKSAVQAVNYAIRQGKAVYLTNDGYIVEQSVFSDLLTNYALYGSPLYKKPSGQQLKALKIYAPPHHYAWAGVDSPVHSALALQSMGFELTSSAEEADVILLENETFDASLLGRKPTIIIGGAAMQRLEQLGILSGFDAEQLERGSDYEGLMKSLIDDQDPLTSGYQKEGLFYSNSGNWIKTAPMNFKTLMRIAGEDYYIAGWWPQNSVLANQIVAIAGNYQEQPLFIYAGNPANRLHPVHFYRWLSNAVFGSQLAELTDLITSEQDSPVEHLSIVQPRTPHHSSKLHTTYAARPVISKK